MTDHEITATDRRRWLDVRWQSAKAAIWRLDAEHALQIDRALSRSLHQLQTQIAADSNLAQEIRRLALLAWDELCETPDPRRQPNQLEA